MKPHDTHGNPDYLTIEHLEKAAKLDNLSLDNAVENLRKTVEVAKAEPQHQHR
jgi:DNA-directed RNA polymerase subunit F